jgi:hypothetical protein
MADPVRLIHNEFELQDVIDVGRGFRSEARPALRTGRS